MANTSTQHHRRPRRVRARTERAQGLPPELTAQPHPFTEELGIRDVEEEVLSLSPEDLGSHFLSEAVEQGDLTARDQAELEQALLDAETESDDLLRSDEEFAAWAKLVERAASDPSASPALLEAVGLEDAPIESEPDFDEPRARESGRRVRLDESMVREVSLLDREGPLSDETFTPEIDIDDTGRHARVAHRGAFGEPIRDAAQRPTAKAGKPTRKHTARNRLESAAGKLRALAGRIARRARRG